MHSKFPNTFWVANVRTYFELANLWGILFGESLESCKNEIGSYTK
jgi:hypothetical protein